jgi:hypothetical protein
MKNKILCKVMLGLLLLASPYAFSQNVSLGPDGSTGSAPDPSAVLDLSNITNGGFLLPCMTTGMIGVGGTQLPNGGAYPNSMLVFCTDDNCFWSYYNNGGTKTWFNDYCLCSSAPTAVTTPSGPATCTVSTTGNTYTTSATGATSFTWSVPTSVGTIVSGQGTATITVTAASSSGSGTITVTANNSCGSTAAGAGLAVTVVPACTDNIVLDNQVTSGVGTHIFNITTHSTNELVIISCNGVRSSAFGGSVSVNQGIGAPTFYNGLSTTNCCLAIYWFVAPTAKTYQITVTETGYSYYDNFAVALEGFCNTPSISNFANSNTGTLNSNAHSIPSSGTVSLTETANSYVVGFATANFNSNGQTPTWSPAGDWTNGSDDGNDDDYGDVGQAISSAATGAISCLTSSHSINYGVMYLIDIN